MEILYVDPFEKTVTAKERYQQAGDEEVTLDFFLFTSLQEIVTCRTMNQLQINELRKSLSGETISGFFQDEDQAQAPAPDLTAGFEQLAQWYATTYAQLTSGKPLNYSHCGEVLPIFALFVLDFEALARKFGDVEQVIQEALKDELLAKTVKPHFPDYALLMLKFFAWRYDSSGQTATADLKSVPPIGRFLPIFMKMQDRLLRQKGNGGKPFSGNRKPVSRGQQRESGPSSSSRPKRSAAAERPVRSNPSGGNTRKSPAYRERKEGKKPGSADRFRGAANNSGVVREVEQEAIAAVEQAIVLLNSKPALKELKLKPQNSFMRRLQHQKIADQGFNILTARPRPSPVEVD